VRTLIGMGDDLPSLYAAAGSPWLRVNMVSTVDGAATGEGGKSSGINNESDMRVFDALRELADCVIVGAGTARVEGYPPLRRPLVVVSRRGDVPPALRGAEPAAVWLVTCAAAPGLEEARGLLGDDHVLVLGSHRVDLAAMKSALAERGFADQLCEGGPHLLRDLLDQRVVDELDATVVPRVIGGQHPRIADGPPVDVPLTLHTLLEEDGTLLARWFVSH
jgi:riboflavin biosynthesis pyrimidine reductase